jgi:hypothetical protein
MYLLISQIKMSNLADEVNSMCMIEFKKQPIVYGTITVISISVKSCCVGEKGMLRWRESKSESESKNVSREQDEIKIIL